MKNLIKVQTTAGIKEMTYEEISMALGFTPSAHFVKITNRHTIEFYCGKPDEIADLIRACLTNGFKMSQKLEKLAYALGLNRWMDLITVCGGSDGV